jgi:hypothetical protein
MSDPIDRTIEELEAEVRRRWSISAKAGSPARSATKRSVPVRVEHKTLRRTPRR